MNHGLASGGPDPPNTGRGNLGHFGWSHLGIHARRYSPPYLLGGNRFEASLAVSRCIAGCLWRNPIYFITVQDNY